MMELYYIIFTLFFWFIGFLILWKIPQCDIDVSVPSNPESVSIIIPARNEAHNLPNLLHSIQTQANQPLEILVVNDESSDNTENIAQKYGAQVINVTNKPDGWNGKSYACWLGAKHAKGETLLFLDADTRLSPNGFLKIINTFRRQSGLLSIQPYHAVQTWGEKLSAILNVMVMAGFNTFTPLGHKWKPPGSFGPCIICLKEDYFKTGGHDAVKTERLEDIPFGKNFMSLGYSVYTYGGKNAVHFRMYPNGIYESIQGWAKSFAIGASSTHPAILIATILWISGAFMAIASLFQSGIMAFILYTLFAFQMFWIFKHIGQFGWMTALLFPFPLFFFLGTYLYSFVLSFIKRRIEWKGRVIER